ncbi:hypothetical protein [Filobacillus milosensis]|nr:hypothetical protein [Filobacillus milosensis]
MFWAIIIAIAYAPVIYRFQRKITKLEEEVSDLQKEVSQLKPKK